MKGQGKGPVILKLISVSGQGDTESPLTDFDPNHAYTWEFASFGSSNSNGGQLFQIDASSFENATNGGTFTTGYSQGALNINYIPAPEPTSVSLLCLASLMCLRQRRGR